MIQDVYTGSWIQTFSHPGSHGQKAMDPGPALSFLTWPKRSGVEQIKILTKRVFFQLSDCKELKFEGLGNYLANEAY
jgi:hypothetical protein